MAEKRRGLECFNSICHPQILEEKDCESHVLSRSEEKFLRVTITNAELYGAILAKRGGMKIMHSMDSLYEGAYPRVERDDILRALYIVGPTGL